MLFAIYCNYARKAKNLIRTKFFVILRTHETASMQHFFSRKNKNVNDLFIYSSINTILKFVLKDKKKLIFTVHKL